MTSHFDWLLMYDVLLTAGLISWSSPSPTESLESSTRNNLGIRSSTHMMTHCFLLLLSLSATSFPPSPDIIWLSPIHSCFPLNSVISPIILSFILMYTHPSPCFSFLQYKMFHITTISIHLQSAQFDWHPLPHPFLALSLKYIFHIFFSFMFYCGVVLVIFCDIMLVFIIKCRGTTNCMPLSWAFCGQSRNN